MDICFLLQAHAKDFSDLRLIVIGSTLIFLIGAIFLLIYVYVNNEKKRKHMKEKDLLQQTFQNQLLQSQVEVQEATFSSLGKELHDNVGQLLGTAKMLIGVSQRNLAASADTIRTADETLSQAIYELRSLSKTLNKEWLEQFDLKENLQTEINRINAAGIMKISLLDHTGSIPFSAEEQIILFRIVQEAVQNAVKHSGADTIIIQLQDNNTALEINITDNGKGFTVAHSSNGVGLLNMKHRAALLKGQIYWNSLDQGTSVVIHLPIQASTP